MSRLLSRISALESKQPPAADESNVVVFYNDAGERIGAKINGQPYDGPLPDPKDCAVFSVVRFVSPPNRPDDDA